MYEIRIELRSNLCASSGDGYASTIDTDIVVDQYGIPYIPARRLKGCLRDAAVYLYGEDSDIINKIFGISGNSHSGALKVENAKIEEYDSFSKMCIENGLSANRVTELFTDTFASTAVESSGAAKENSLRFMRFVSKSKAWEPDENLVFCADIEIDNAYADDLIRICKALRHIGFKRNRGFGNVKCSLVNKNSNTKSFDIPTEIIDDNEYVITYAIRLDEHLMLPSQACDESADYISGQAVVGALAGKYLKSHDADDYFDSLFLSGEVKFSNLFITNEAFQSFVPVPQIFGKTKQSNHILDLTVTQSTEIVKPLKNGYINADLQVIKPLTERVYHNNLKNADGGLYVQNCLQKDQIFMGSILGKGCYIKIIAELLLTGKLSFGRSKTAQYSRCSIIGFDLAIAAPKKLHLHKGDKIVYLFESDVLLTDSLVGNPVDISSVCNAIGINKADLEPESSLKYRMISGYLSVMKMQRAHIRAVAAGSVLVLNCNSDMETDEILYIGGRQNEGFGKVRIFKAGELLKGSANRLNAESCDSSETNSNVEEMFAQLEKDEKMRNDAISYALDNKSSFLNKWGAAFVGRVILMLKQSDSEADFRNRIKSIKSQSKLQVADNFLKDAANKWESDPKYKVWIKKQEYLLIILTLAKYFLKEHKGGTAK